MDKPVRSSFQYLSISYECALAIGNSLNLSEMLQEVIHTVVHKTNAHRGIIWVKNGAQELQPVANAGINIEDVLAQGEIKDLRDVLNQILKKQQFVLRYEDDTDFLQYCPALTGKEESVLIVPITNVAILYLVYAGREIADEPLANLLASLSKKLSVAIEACTAHENVIKEIQVREKAENKLTKKTEQLVSSQKELQGLYGESEQARKSLLSILEDVTQKEEALKETTELLQSVMDNATDEAIITTDQMGTILIWNEGAKRLLGYEPEEVEGRENIRIFHTKEYLKSGILDVNFKNMIATGKPQTLELDYITKDGKTIPTQTIVSPRFDDDGNFKGMVGMARDITERKQAEEALKKSEEKFRSLFEYGLMGVAITSSEMGWIEVNDHLCELLGYTRDEMVTKTWCEMTHPEDLVHDVEQFNRLVGGEIDNYSMEKRFIRKDGKVIDSIMSVSSIRHPDGSVDYMVAFIQDISNRKKAEENLRASEEKYSTLVEKGNDGIIILQDGLLKFANLIMCEMTGYAKDEIIGKSFLDFVVPEHRKIVWERYEKRLRGHSIPNRYVVEIIPKDMGNISVEINATQIEYEGKPADMAIIRDITARVKVRLELQESQKNITDLIENSPDGIIIANAEGKHIFANNMMCEMLGYGYEELMEITIKEMTPPEDLGKYKKMNDARVCGEEVPNLYERSIIKKDGSIIPVELRTATTVWAGEKCALAFITDITERKKVETAFKESEQRLLRAQEVAHVGDWEFDVKTGVSVWSDEIYSIYGFDPADEIESEIMIAGMHPDDLDYINEKFAGWVKSGEGEPFEYRIVRPDGSIRHVYSPAEVVRDSNGNVVKVYGTALDITDQKDAKESLKTYAEELARSNEELKSLDKMKNEFLSNVSHELKTPLISIKGFSEIVQDELYGPINDQQKKAMSTIIRNSERLSRLINSILYLTIKKSGKDTYAIHPIDITEIIGNALIDISPQANSKELTIENNTLSDLPLIKGDMDKLTQVFINLFENATKFTPNDGKITVAAFEDNENIHITVSDTGIGISNEVISNLFDKFYQVDASTTRKYGGTGIGLYISKLIVEVHKGKIWAESEEGSGTTFHVLLPK
ncbi:MAG TPA: PAS domain S-box protein [Methanosarcinaceae archaeon]|nr:PAS domain S-box protein [Methanosarcinaceae archaeon]